MKKRLWLDNRYVEIQCKPYDYLVQVYQTKFANLFDDLENESDKVANEYFECLGQQYSPDEVDMDYLVDASFNKGLEHFEMTRLAEYNMTLMWFATMYQFWEQQVRHYLYLEGGYRMQSENPIAFKNFCNNIHNIKKEFLKYEYEIEKLACWKDINELRLLANVIKHGEGSASEELKKLRPDFFYDEFLDANVFDLYGTSLNEKTLVLNEKQLLIYKGALQAFWSELLEIINGMFNREIYLF